MTTFATIIGVLLFIAIISMIFGAKNQSSQNNETPVKKLTSFQRFLADKNMSESDIFNSKLKYIDGYPSNATNGDRKVIYFANRGDKVFAYSVNESYFAETRYLFEISKAEITDISVEDQSTIEKKITVGRLLLVGIFAFAWKKKKTNELFFLVITFNDGKFNHNVVFQSDGKDSRDKCNTARNNLIGWCKK